MKSLLFCLVLLTLLSSCNEKGRAKIIIPSMLNGTPFTRGAIIYAVNRDQPEFTRRISLTDINQELEVELVAGEYVFQAIGLDWNTDHFQFSCAENLGPFHVADGGMTDVDLEFRADNCNNKDVFKNPTNSPQVTNNYQIDLCLADPDTTFQDFPPTPCNQAMASIRFTYLADIGPGISFCVETANYKIANRTAIIPGNININPAGHVFSVKIQGFSNPGCAAPLSFDYLFPKGLDPMATPAGIMRLINFSPSNWLLIRLP